MEHLCEIPISDEALLYGCAVVTCYEDDKGRFVMENGEYGTYANFCPFCGMKAPTQSPS